MADANKQLSEEQQLVLDKVLHKGKSIFFTGCAGTGKTFLLKKIISEFQQSNTKPGAISITASTGRAAFSIGGTTLHSFVGAGLGLDDIKSILEKIKYNKKVIKRWRDVKLLIIDEVSMLDAVYFDKVEAIAREVRRNNEPFGGVQVVLTGDLLQLPPVNEGNTKKKRIFESDAWKTCISECIALHEVFRQSDHKFIEILTAIRVGAQTEEVLDFMQSVSRPIEYDSESGPVNLYATRAKTDYHNQARLSEIDSENITFTADDTYGKSSKSAISTLEQCPVPAALEIKVGAQVMLVKNLTKDLVNGTVGVVTKFTKPINLSDTQKESFANYSLDLESIPIVRFTLADGRVFTRPMSRQVWETKLPGGELVASRCQIPLILAWAVTIHKSQGQTIQRLKVDLSNVFESGQVYTAVSRAVSPDTLEVIGFNPQTISADRVSLEFCVNNDLL
jgi:ATP-dependent DNA helicase PIF1